MPLDNAELIERFVPPENDGDTFIYTELLDRSSGKGRKSARLIRTFYHQSKEQFIGQLPLIRTLCEATGARAYTRLAPRSFRAVGKTFGLLVVEAALSGVYHNMRNLYSRACGTVTPNTKLWLYDVDEITVASEALRARLEELGLLVACIPSRKGVHYITHPHAPHAVAVPASIALHRDNPTNLYVPDAAA